MFNEHQEIFQGLIDSGIAPYVAEAAVRAPDLDVREALVAVRTIPAGWTRAHAIIGFCFTWAGTPQGLDWWSGQHKELCCMHH